MAIQGMSLNLAEVLYHKEIALSRVFLKISKIFKIFEKSLEKDAETYEKRWDFFGKQEVMPNKAMRRVLTYFLLQLLKLLGVKKINQRYAEAVTEHLYRYNARIYALSV